MTEFRPTTYRTAFRDVLSSFSDEGIFYFTLKKSWYPEGYNHGFYYFNNTSITEIYPLTIHDRLPIYRTAFRDVLASFSDEGIFYFTLKKSWYPEGYNHGFYYNGRSSVI